MNNLRIAIKKDFKVGAVIYNREGWPFSINEHYQGTQWNTREGKFVSSQDAQSYKVKIK